MKKIIPLLSLLVLVSCGTNRNSSPVVHTGSTVYVGEEFTGAILAEHIMTEDSVNATIITEIPDSDRSGVVDISSDF